MDKTTNQHIREYSLEEKNEYYMKRAIQLAKHGMGYTNPNPMVGAVIVKDGKIIGEGYHEAYGKAHAEVNALRNCKVSPKESTMYVTLEPCSHTGKTPPCVWAIIEANIKSVYIGMEDPNPMVAGRGITILEEAGISVTCGVLEEEAMDLNRIFIKYITTGRPYMIMKSAMTLDGKISSVTGDAKWITSPEARDYVHKLRHQVSAIMVGIGTVLADNPRLTTRLPNGQGRHPLRIILDTTCRIPIDAALLREKGDTLIIVSSDAPESKVCQLKERDIEVMVMNQIDRPDLVDVMEVLGKRGIDSVLLEGGSCVNANALEANIVDEVMMFIAPKIIGGEEAKTPVGGVGIPLMADTINLHELHMETIGPDILIRGRIEEG